MTMPKAYDPEYGYKFQILCRNLHYSRSWEHLDYAKDSQEKKYLLGEYRMAQGAGWEYKTIQLPEKFWN